MTNATAQIVAQVSLFFTEGSSDKVYHAQVREVEDGCVVEFQYGRRGSSLTAGAKTKEPVDRVKALKIFDKLVTEKKAKGYTESESGEVFQGSDNAGRKTGLVPNLLNPLDVSGFSAAELQASEKWVAQEKYDGERRMLIIDGDEVTGSNRKGLSVPLPQCIVDEAKVFGIDGKTILDGEIIGNVFVAFDCLMLAGKDLTGLTVVERFNVFNAPLAYPSKPLPAKGLLKAYMAISEEDKTALRAALMERNAEGIVYKYVDAQYTPGRPDRGGYYIKDKFVATASVICLGLNEGKSSVAVGVLREDGSMRELGNVTVMANQSVPEKESILEVRYLYAYPNGSLFQPVLLGQRSDIDRADCTEAQLKYKEAA